MSTTKDSRVLFGATRKTDLFMIPVDHLAFITDAKSVLYDEYRLNLPVNEDIVQAMIKTRRIDPVLVRRTDDVVHVLDGLQRVKAIREANKRLRASKEEPLLVPCERFTGTDQEALAAMLVSFIRSEDSPTGKAEKIAKYIATGATVQDAARVAGVTVRTIQNYGALLECAAPVRRAVEKGQIALATAYQAKSLPADKQIKIVEKLVKESGGKKVKSAAGKRAVMEERGPSKAKPKAAAATNGHAAAKTEKPAENLLPIDDDQKENVPRRIEQLRSSRAALMQLLSRPEEAKGVGSAMIAAAILAVRWAEGDSMDFVASLRLMISHENAGRASTSKSSSSDEKGAQAS